MASTTTARYEAVERVLDAHREAEAVVREFAAAYPTPNVLRAVALCESGRLAWPDVAKIAEAALTRAMAEVDAR